MTRWFFALALFAGVAPSCGGHTGDGPGQAPNGSGGGGGDTPPEGTGSACHFNSDCIDPLICNGGICSVECKTTRDCPSGQTCVGSGSDGVCRLRSEHACTHNSDCISPLVCAADLQCRNQCAEARDCPSGESCSSGRCLPPSETSRDAGSADADPCRIPTSPVYDCPEGPGTADSCAAVTSADAGASPAWYPLGCGVELPERSGSNLCGPQHCTCSNVLQADGAMRPSWVCPL